MKPLVKFQKNTKDYYLFGIRNVLYILQIYGRRINEGRFPYKLEEEENISKIIKLIKKDIEINLEKELDKKLIEIFGTEYVESRLDNFHRINRSLPKDPECGEIDSIAIDKRNKVVHVLEAKYVKTGIVPQEISNEIKKFFSPYSDDSKDYTKMLIKKNNFVSDNIDTFLEYFKIHNSKGWKTKPAFVTSETHFTAYLTKNKIKFIRLSKLEEYLKEFDECN